MRTMLNVIILAAGDISSKLPFLVPKSRSPALVPINTRPLVFYLIEFYRSIGGCSVNIFVAHDQLEAVVSELLSFKDECQIYPLPKTEGVNESLKMAVAMVSEAEEVVVNLVTTIPVRLPQTNEVQISNKVTPYQVCSNIILKAGGVVFSPKKEPLKEPGYPFTGIFRVRTDDLIKALGRTKISDDLLYVVMSLGESLPLKYVKVDWKDCGHEINYYETRSRLISSRTFNNITVSPEKGILRKASRQADKLRQEFEYMLFLPVDIQVYFPRILTGFQETGKEAGFFEMEYYGYPNVAEYQLYWEVSPANWYRIFSRLQNVLREFKKYTTHIGPDTSGKIYFDKTRLRVQEYHEQLKRSGRDISWFNGETIINGVTCKPISELWGAVEERARSIYRQDDFCIIHGDFCFNNMLYDLPSGVLRLVDPRGSFGIDSMSIYGDQKYDLAKLAHSAGGGYDYFVNDLFEISIDDRHFNYSLNLRENQALIDMLCRQTIAELGYDEDDIRFIMGLLFVSMCALHYESTQRQQAMYVHGLRILNEVLV